MTAPEAIRWQGGLHIVGTPLWCDVLRPRGACFVSSVTTLLGGRSGAKQLIVSGDVGARITALGLVPPHALLTVRPYRPFTLGRARLEILETGEANAAALSVEVDGRRLLYVDALPHSGVTLRDADVLIVGRTLVADPVKQLDHMVQIIDHRLQQDGRADVVVRDPAWLPVLARWPLRLSPQLAALARELQLLPNGTEPLASSTTPSSAFVTAGLRGPRTHLLLDKRPSDASRIGPLAESLSAKTLFVAPPLPIPASAVSAALRVVEIGRPTQLPLWPGPPAGVGPG